MSKKETAFNDIVDAYPLTMLQAGMIFHSELNPDSAVYHDIFMYQLPGQYDDALLKESIRQMMLRHAVLRTSFNMDDFSQPLQLVHRQVDVPISEDDMSLLSKDERDRLISHWIEKEKKKSFDWKVGPLYRFHVFEISDHHFTLVFSFHHSILDGWSVASLMTELGNLYLSKIEGKDYFFQPLPKITFRDYVALEQQALVCTENKNYWKNKLQDSSFSVIHRWPMTEKKAGVACSEVVIPPWVSQGLNGLAKEIGVPVKNILLAAHLRVMNLVHGDDDVVTGLATNGRLEEDGGERILGLFLNTVPFRMKMTGGSWAQLIHQTFDAEKELLPYRRYPLLQIQKDLGKSVLFESAFNFTNFHVYKGSKYNNEPVPDQQSGNKDFEQTNFPFLADFSLRISDNRVLMRIIYDTNEFCREQIQAIEGYYIRTFAEMVENPQGNYENNMSLLSQQEKELLMEDWQGIKPNVPKTKTLHELFEEQAARAPDATAIEFKDRKLTYRELNEKSNQLARVLRHKGVGPDVMVGIMMERSIEMMVGILGILKAGGAYLPIDPGYPAQRIKYMIQDSGVQLLLTSEQLMNAVDLEAEYLLIDNQSLYNGECSNLENRSTPENPAYVIYTSGSTGNPKGTVTSHFNVLGIVKDTNYIEITAKDTLLQLSNYAFDGSVFDIYGALLNGARLVLVDKDTVLNVHALSEVIKNSGITVMFVTTALFNTLVDLNMDCFGNIRKVLFGGERVSVQHVKKAFEFLGLGKLLHVYGPTETTVFATSYPVDSMRNLESTIPIGKPLSNTRLYVLGKDDRLQAPGVPGELCIAGDGLAAGYLNHPQLSLQKFVRNPFSPSEKMYKTGDLVRWLPDGNIEFLGRMDNQVKIRGFRIELGEIESQLLQYEAIKEAIVVAREDMNGSKDLCAYVVSKEELAPGEIREYLSNKLPAYMIPSFFMQIDKMPLTPNGKIDSKTLPEPDAGMNTGTLYEAPRNKLEEELAVIWKGVLKVDKISIHDNFFELGGHSLKATTLAFKINKELNVELPLSEIFSSPTIKELAGYIKEAGKNKYSSIQPVEPKEYYPVSSAQKRLYLINLMEGKNTSYNMPAVIEILGYLDGVRLEEAFKKLIERHESLRTTFEFMDGQPVQKIHPQADFQMDYLELEAADIPQKIKEFVTPFDFTKAPLIRAGLIKVSESRHILIYDMHHIISDGISMNIIIREFICLYTGKQLPELRVRYKDFSAWQNQRLETDTLKKQQQYWLEVFTGEIPLLNMPTDYQRPSVQSFEGSSLDFELDKELAEGLANLAAKTGTTLYMVLLAAYNILLSKYSGQEGIVVGTPIAGRRHSDLENIVGMFVNTLAMRNYPEGSKPFIQFLEEVKGNSLKAYENQDYQFEQLVEMLDLKRDLSRNPLFDTMFSLQNMEMSEVHIEGLDFKPCAFDREVSQFDLTLDAVEENETIAFSLGYCTKLFRKETMERFAGHYVNLLRAITKDYAVKLSDLDMLSEKEKRQILTDFNNTKAEYSKDATLCTCFEKQAQKTPDRIAFSCMDTRLTYRQLNEKSNRIARLLMKKGMEKEDLAAVLLDRSLTMAESILGIWKAGGAYIPLDTAYPYGRILQILEESKAPFIVTMSGYVSKELEEAYPGRIIKLDESMGEIEEMSSDSIVTSVDGSNLAYVIFTSGSTGVPKGAMIEHLGMLNHIEAEVSELEISENSVIAQNASHCFDISVWQFFAGLTVGAKTVLYPNELVADPKEFTRRMVQDGISILEVVPSYLWCMLEYQEEVQMDLGHLRYLLITGETVPSTIVRKCFELNPGVKIVNAYGPAEASDDVAQYTMDCAPHSENIPIGKPLRNTNIYIVQKDMNLCPIGVEGEICISGIGVGRGYLNNPGKTAEVFMEDPYSQEKGVRLYKTGDMGRWLPDGNIEFLGRKDHQVKIRGYRIELGEIETRLQNHSSIKDAVVLVRENLPTGKSICAYIVGNEPLTTGELRKYLLKELPDYMIPSYFIQLDKMPLNPNGKVDRKALPAPDGSVDTGIEYEAPRNKLEEELVHLWKDVLGVDRIGINDNFFELGGHSLRATTLVSKVHKQLNMELNLRQIFKSPTIRELALHLDYAEGTGYCSLQPAAIKEYYPLSPAQKRMYILRQFESSTTSYNGFSAIAIEGNLDKEKLEDMFRQLIDRHENLRTSFEVVDGTPVQKVHKTVDFKITCMESEEDKVEPIANDFIRPFDLRIAPLMRVALVKVSEQRNILFLDMHHIISDGVSMSIMTRELSTLYSGEKLPELRIQYKDFSQWQNRMLETDAIKKQKKYWLDLFAGEIPVLNMPTDYPRPSVQSFEGDHISFEIDSVFSDALAAMAFRYEVTMYMLLLAAFNVLLSKYSGQEDIIVGSPIAGRQHADLENIIGMFVNTLAMRNFPESHKTFAQFLDEVKENALKAYENQDYQFEDLVDHLNLVRDLSRNPLFDVMFVLQNMEVSEFKANDIRLKEFAFETQVALFDIRFEVEELNNGLRFNLEYCTALYKRETMERLASHFVNILKQVTEYPQIPLSEIDILSEEERRLVLFDFNDTRADYPKTKTIHALFEEQVRKTPDTIAVVFEDEKLTYRQLNEKANKLARFLCEEHRITSDSMVGVMMERSHHMIIAIYGILKAGGAYVPIDPEYPEERMKTVLNDAGIQVLISSKKNIRTLNRLQWDCPALTSFLCLDSEDVYGEEDTQENGLMDEKLWEYIGSNAADDIEGGGWSSSYTGQSFSKEEMDEYVDNTFKKLQPYLNKGARVLEIGCASGLTLFKVVPHVGFYYATDLSGTIIERNRQRVIKEGIQNIQLERLAAHEIDRIQEKEFDIIIINSVIHLFQGHNYLRKVILKAIDMLGEKGVLFIGDIIDQEKKTDLIQSLIDFKQEHLSSKYRTKTDYSAELFVSRDYFSDLQADIQKIEKINISNKLYTIENELTRYRYDAIIEIDKARSDKPVQNRKKKYQFDSGVLERYDNTDMDTKVSSNSVAYVIYTSGSTGMPKGTMIEHYSVINRLNWMQKKYPIGEEDVILQKTPFTFDVSVWELFWWSFQGATVCFLASGGEKDPEEIMKAIEKNKVTTLHFVPSMLGIFLEHVKDAGVNGLSSLRQVFASGEALSLHHVRQFNDLLNKKTGTTLHNLYGPTEATVDVSYFDCSTGEEADTIPIGKPIDNIHLYIVDKNGKPLPVGISGELCIAGDGLARGYLNRPELTAAKFVPNPFIKGERMYRTGDLTRWLPDGNIEFLGRMDHQVKIRGFRIELGEIESQLSKHESIKEAVVVAREHQDGSRNLCAYIVSERELTFGEMREYLSRALPDYMIPSYFVQLDKLPLNANGKIDRKALPEPDGSVSTGVGYEAPGNQLEEELVKIWKDILGVDRIGINDNFFELGGHSLRATVLVSKVHKLLNIKMSLEEVFSNQTVAAQAKVIQLKNNKMDELEQILLHMENLSDEEVLRLLYES